MGCTMLQHTAPMVEDSGFDGRLVGMLHDSGENINWCEIEPTPLDPDQPRVAIYGDEMPPPPPGNLILSYTVISRYKNYSN